MTSSRPAIEPGALGFEKWHTIGILAFNNLPNYNNLPLPKSLIMKMVGRDGFEPS